ncbi:MAG: helicase-exonuclease AddAB subunit AddA [Planctomycetes bacterium]|nr:helicase-exonuclease AddAB subunit AddA [Planctomycetota bacterium]
MAEKNLKWTEQQQRAIAARGSDVSVTASAGTGKTAVLSGRCVDIVSDKTDVLNILVLTFTNAAADEMRSRIAEQLHNAFLENGDAHLRYQLMLLGGADISTIDSFCKRLITEYFYELGLDPTFRVIESDEQKLLKAEVLEQTIEWAWEQSNLRQGFGQLLRRRDLRINDGFGANIIEISNFLDGSVSRDDWYKRALLLAETANPLAGELGEKQKEILLSKSQSIVSRLCHARKLCEKESGSDWVGFEDTFIKPIEECVKFLQSGDWDSCAKAIRDYKKPRVNKPKELSEATAELIKKTVKAAVDDFAKLKEFAVINPDYLDRVSGASSLQTKVMIELVKKFDRLYSQAKRKFNCLDFADLEHYALRLLKSEDSPDGKLLPSQTALMLRSRYKYIFVDEYQDINPVQQAILDLLSSGGNVFVVGDVKQSIYAFRGAEPDIFLERLKDASSGLRVDLNTNWRSEKGILDFVNKVFGRIMTSSFAKIDYDESAKLQPAPKASSTNEPAVELHILDEQGKSTDESDEETPGVYTGRQRQAMMIAERIKQMVASETGKAEFQIYDKQQDEKRPVEYRDIVILMRSPSVKVNEYVEILRLAGVPVSCEGAAGYFEKTEISDLLCLLKVLDNPQRDIELAAVLRSPFFNVSDTQLAKIRIHSQTDEQAKSFYGCVLGYCDSGSDTKLTGRLKEILETIENWRTLARRGILADLIWQIYRRTGFLSFVSALPSGRVRKANLLKLHDRAIQFEGFVSSGGIASLRRFVEFIERLEESGQDWASAEPEAAAGNAVRIISVHRSKGLEFPVVFLAELDSPFSKRDSKSDYLADMDGALGLKIIDDESNAKLDSIAYQVVEEQKKQAALAEEMRILYVATTRARQRLVLTACKKKSKCRDIICDGLFFGDKAIADWQLSSSKSHFGWVLYGLCDQKNLHNTFNTGFANKCIDDTLFSVKLYDSTELNQLCEHMDGLKKAKPVASKAKKTQADTKLLGQVKQALGWKYKFGDVAFLPAKQSVTQLTHRNDEYVKIDYSKSLEPKADSAGKIDGKLIGAATHLVIAKLDLSKPVTETAVEETIEKLVLTGAIQDSVTGHINKKSIVTFFESELGKTALDCLPEVWREWPFSFAMTPTKSKFANDETVIVQGIIDMLVRTPKGLLLIDFKTDYLSAGQVHKRAESYRQQLDYYSRAAEAILKTKVVGKYLYFLIPASAVEV